MATRIAEILQFNKCLNQFIFVSLNKLRMSTTIQQFHEIFASSLLMNYFFTLFLFLIEISFLKLLFTFNFIMYLYVNRLYTHPEDTLIRNVSENFITHKLIFRMKISRIRKIKIFSFI
jgi:hypothetical protein